MPGLLALRWLTDIVALAQQSPPLNWALIDERSRTWRCQRAVQLARFLIEVALPAPGEERGMPTTDVCRLATQIWAYADQPTEPSISGSDLLKLKLALPDRQQDRLRLASQWLFGLNFQDMATAESSKTAAYLYRPLRPSGAGEDFYRSFAAQLGASGRPVVIFSIADCLRPHLSPDFEVFYCDGHLTCFRRAGIPAGSSAT